MKVFWCVMAGLVVLTLLLALRVTGRPRAAADCTSSVVIVHGRHGEAVECVCVNGAISTCFAPGP
ncbi:MAG TPA: hypothetical protein VHC93_23010 [Methylomirabilota bacterium]|jgi:hypothetical protein|nr:hypothetical protein [Methylomirabilota bacterium]